MFQKAKGKDQDDSWFIRVPFCTVISFVLLFCYCSYTYHSVSISYSTIQAVDINTLLYTDLSVCPADCFDTVSMKCTHFLDRGKPPKITLFIC